MDVARSPVTRVSKDMPPPPYCCNHSVDSRCRSSRRRERELEPRVRRGKARGLAPKGGKQKEGKREVLKPPLAVRGREPRAKNELSHGKNKI